jgi:hypothetical protein
MGPHPTLVVTRAGNYPMMRSSNWGTRRWTVGKMQTTSGDPRQINRKTKEGSHHPDRMDSWGRDVQRRAEKLLATGRQRPAGSSIV